MTQKLCGLFKSAGLIKGFVCLFVLAAETALENAALLDLFLIVFVIIYVRFLF